MDETNPAYAANYREAFYSLCDKRLIGQVSEKLFNLTGTGFKLAENLNKKGIYNFLKLSEYLTNGQYAKMDLNQLKVAFSDLVSFIRGLSHGEHFVERIKRCIYPPSLPSQVTATVIGPGFDVATQQEEDKKEREHQLRKVTEEYRIKIGNAQAEIENILKDILMSQDISI